MASVVQLMANPRYPNILVNRSVPILFVAICFLIVANTRCDQVGSANGDSTNLTPKTEDPLSFFREIYLDQNSKIIAMMPNSRDTVLPRMFHKYDPSQINIISKKSFASPKSQTHKSQAAIQADDNDNGELSHLSHHYLVQKFHPNGRYGRSFAGASKHSELARLRVNDGGRLSSILQNSLGDLTNNYQLKNHEINDLGQLVSDLDSGSSMDYQLEMNKLLKCNYTGVSNIYRCNLDK